MLMFVVGVTYAPIAPLMLPFCCLFFVIAYLVYKYLFLYVHVPRYENKAQSIPLVVNRCLAGLVIMQLTMMGLLALKSIGPEENGRHRMVLSKQPGWSGYAQMVAGIAPLLMLTGMVYWWLRQGYEKEIIQVPIEVISKAMRGVSIQPGAAFNSPDTHDSFAFDGQELEPFSGVGDVSHESHPPSMKADASIESPNDVPGFTSENDVNGAVSDPETLGLRVDTDMDGDVNEETSLLGDAFHSALQSSHPEMLDDNVLAYHLEPPMTRVQGILDAPVTFDPLSQDADLQNASYLHPALIGRLPVPWLSSKEEVGPPESSSSLGVLERLRSEQSRRQRQSLKRFLGRQRLGVRAMEEEQVGDGDAADRSLSGQTSFPCLDRQLHMQRPFRRVRNFMDGLTAWAHLTLS